MRSPIEVGNAMLAVWPDSPEKTELSHLIETDFPYKAPEQAATCFGKITRLVNRVVPGPPTESWQISLVALLMDKTEDDVREQFVAAFDGASAPG